MTNKTYVIGTDMQAVIWVNRIPGEATPELTEDLIAAARYFCIDEDILNHLAEARAAFPDAGLKIQELHAFLTYGIYEWQEESYRRKLLRASAIAKLTPEECAALDIPLSEQLNDQVPHTGESDAL